MIFFILFACNQYLNSNSFKIDLLNHKLENDKKKWRTQHQPQMRHLADLLFFDEQYELSERWYRRAIEMNPKNTCLEQPFLAFESSSRN